LQPIQNLEESESEAELDLQNFTQELKYMKNAPLDEEFNDIIIEKKGRVN
jgi:hypothetical protein